MSARGLTRRTPASPVGASSRSFWRATPRLVAIRHFHRQNLAAITLTAISGGVLLPMYTNGAAQSLQRCLSLPKCSIMRARRARCCAASQCHQCKTPLTPYFQQRQIVQLGVREGYHATAAVGLEGGHHIVWHVSNQLGARHVPAADKLFAWIAHRHGKTAEQRHGGRYSANCPAPDEQHALVFRAEGVGELRASTTSSAGAAAACRLTRPSASSTVRCTS